jgi:hypothetical protein
VRSAVRTGDGILAAPRGLVGSRRMTKIDRSTSIVSETKQILNPRNSSLKSRAQIFDGSQSRFVMARRESVLCHINALPCSKQSSGKLTLRPTDSSATPDLVSAVDGAVANARKQTARTPGGELMFGPRVLACSSWACPHKINEGPHACAQMPVPGIIDCQTGIGRGPVRQKLNKVSGLQITSSQ